MVGSIKSGSIQCTLDRDIVYNCFFFKCVQTGLLPPLPKPSENSMDGHEKIDLGVGGLVDKLYKT